MAERPDRRQQIAEISQMLTDGVKEVFSSGRYAEWLNTMTKFHTYSLRNQMLIFLQNPNASYVAGFNKWKELGRSVDKGEHGIRILAPAPYKTKELLTHDENGELLKPPHETEVTHMAFKPAYVFDISQTHGRELPELTHNLEGEVRDFESIFKAIEAFSPYPISFEQIGNGANGYCDHSGKRIVIREGLSQEQTVKTAIHELAHGIMHTPDVKRDRTLFEVQAESVAYIVCRHFGINTSQYSFGYVAGWAQDKELKALTNSLEEIKDIANELIYSLEPEIEHQRELMENENELSYSEMLSFKAIPVAEPKELLMGSDEIKAQLEKSGFEQMESKGRFSDYLLFRDKEINEFIGFYDWQMAAKFASEHRVVSAESKDIRVEGISGSWRVAETKEIHGREYFLLENEQHGKAFPKVIVDNKGFAMTGLTKRGWKELQEEIFSLDANWSMESDDMSSLDYRDELHKGRLRLVQLWDEQYNGGIENVCEDILKSEKRETVQPQEQPNQSSLIKAGELTKGAQIAGADGFLFDVAEVVKQTDKTITVRLCSDFSSFKEHWTVKPDGTPGGFIKTFNKESRLRGFKSDEPPKKSISKRLAEKKIECEKINSGRISPEKSSRDINITR